MDKAVLLAEVRAVLAKVPDFNDYSLSSEEHRRWLARADAVISRWNRMALVTSRPAETLLLAPHTRAFHLNRIMSTLHRAEADLALEGRGSGSQVFGPGAVYDFFKALREIIESAQKTLLIVDPYLDSKAFNTYVTGAATTVKVRLLVRRYAAELASAVAAYTMQLGADVCVRSSEALHDRVIFVDGGSCWVLGQSVKDAANRSPTYIAPLDGEAAAMKLTSYEMIWQIARPVTTQ
jgi:hypothetical protein